MIYEIKKIGKPNNYLSEQPRQIRRNHSYEFAKTTLPVRINQKNTLKIEYITGLSKAEEVQYENQLGLAEGTLDKFSDYWSNFRIRLDNDIKKLNDDEPASAIQISILKTYSQTLTGDYSDCIVAGSLDEIDNRPHATIVMLNPEEEADRSSKLREIKEDAIILSRNFSDEQFKDFAIFINPYADVSRISPKIIKESVLKWRDEHPKEFIEILEKDKSFKKKVMLHKLVNKGIIYIKSGSYYDKQNDEIIGYDLISTIEFLFKPANKHVIDKYNTMLKGDKQETE